METEGEPDISCLLHDFSFAYDNPAFSDRVLHLKVRDTGVPFGQLTATDDGELF
jgi:hypothetical protein